MRSRRTQLRLAPETSPHLLVFYRWHQHVLIVSSSIGCVSLCFVGMLKFWKVSGGKLTDWLGVRRRARVASLRGCPSGNCKVDQVHMPGSPHYEVAHLAMARWCMPSCSMCRLAMARWAIVGLLPGGLSLTDTMSTAWLHNSLQMPTLRSAGRPLQL